VLRARDKCPNQILNIRNNQPTCNYVERKRGPISNIISLIYDLHFRIGYRLGWQLEVFAFYYDDYLQVTSVLSYLNLDWLISLIGFRLAHFRSHSEYCSVTVAAVMVVYQSYRHRVAFSVLELLSLSTLAGFRYFCGLIIFFLHHHTEGLLILSRKDYWAERI